jgi:hypothetical protein
MIFAQEERMKRFKRTLTLMVTVLLLTSLTVPCSAAESSFRELFENTLYGGLVGTLVGGALLVFTSKPSDHLDYLSIGAASGVLAGVAYTVARPAKSMIAVENGNVKIALPAITPEFQENNSKGLAGMILKAELLSGTF